MLQETLVNGFSLTVCLVDNAAHTLQHHEQRQLRLVGHRTPPEVLSKFWNTRNPKRDWLLAVPYSTTEHRYNASISWKRIYKYSRIFYRSYYYAQCTTHNKSHVSLRFQLLYICNGLLSDSQCLPHPIPKIPGTPSPVLSRQTTTLS